MWTILIVVQKVQNKVFNFIKRSKADLQKQVSILRSGGPMTQNWEKVLGLYWDHQRYVISLKISEIFKEAVNIIPNKRNILSIIASVYDPIGYLLPLAIMLKILFQEI